MSGVWAGWGLGSGLGVGVALYVYCSVSLSVLLVELGSSGLYVRRMAKWRGGFKSNSTKYWHLDGAGGMRVARRRAAGVGLCLGASWKLFAVDFFILYSLSFAGSERGCKGCRLFSSIRIGCRATLLILLFFFGGRVLLIWAGCLV